MWTKIIKKGRIGKMHEYHEYYEVEKRLEISASHNLNLDYESKCENLHGHNWIIKIRLHTNKLNENGMVEDFTWIKRIIMEKFDHKNLNDFIEQPTAENIAKYICNMVNELSNSQKCFWVEVQESEGNKAIYELW